MRTHPQLILKARIATATAGPHKSRAQIKHISSRAARRARRTLALRMLLTRLAQHASLVSGRTRPCRSALHRSPAGLTPCNLSGGPSARLLRRLRRPADPDDVGTVPAAAPPPWHARPNHLVLSSATTATSTPSQPTTVSLHPEKTRGPAHGLTAMPLLADHRHANARRCWPTPDTSITQQFALAMPSHAVPAPSTGPTPILPPFGCKAATIRVIRLGRRSRVGAAPTTKGPYVAPR